MEGWLWIYTTPILNLLIRCAVWVSSMGCKVKLVVRYLPTSRSLSVSYLPTSRSLLVSYLPTSRSLLVSYLPTSRSLGVSYRYLLF